VASNGVATTDDVLRWCSRARRARTRTCWRSTSSGSTPATAATVPARATPAPAARDPVFTPRRANRRLAKWLLRTPKEEVFGPPRLDGLVLKIASSLTLHSYRTGKQSRDWVNSKFLHQTDALTPLQHASPGSW